MKHFFTCLSFVIFLFFIMNFTFEKGPRDILSFFSLSFPSSFFSFSTLTYADEKSSSINKQNLSTDDLAKELEQRIEERLRSFDEFFGEGLNGFDSHAQDIFEKMDEIFQDRGAEAFFHDETLGVFDLKSLGQGLQRGAGGEWEETQEELIYKIKTNDDEKESIDIETADGLLTVTKKIRSAYGESQSVTSETLPSGIETKNWNSVHEEGYLKIKFKKTHPSSQKGKEEKGTKMKEGQNQNRNKKTQRSQNLEKLRGLLKGFQGDLNQRNKSHSLDKGHKSGGKEKKKSDSKLLGPYGTESIDAYSPERGL